VEPLEGYRIVDFGTALVGGVAPRMLAELGAEVIKVESRARLDGFRLGRPVLGDEATQADESLWIELQPSMQAAGRDKLSVTLNMNKPEGLDLVKRLIAKSDAAMNNYSPGVLQRRGLDYESLRAIKPDIIVLSMPGAGETGPLRDYVSYAMTAEALSGMGGLAGYEDGPLLGHLPLAWGDVVNAISGALAVVTALHHRNETGQGQSIEAVQLEASAALMGVPYLDYLMNGRIATPRGNFHPMMAPHNNYPTQDDRWVAIAVHSDDEWLAFCQATGHPEWHSDPRYADLVARLEHRDQLDRAVSQWTRERSSDEAVRRLQEQGIAATPVLTTEDQAADDYFFDRGAFVDVEHPLLGRLELPGKTVPIGEMPHSARPAPMLGQDNGYVLGEILGLSTTDIARLVEEEAVY